MLFNSLQFIIFLPLAFCGYWALSKASLRWKNLFIVAVSYLFYGLWDPRFLLLIAFTSLCSFLSGLLIRRHTFSRLVLWVNVLLNLTVLGLFKYFDFFSLSFSQLFGIRDPLILHLVLPVGISFYTFQALSYSIDVYRRQVVPTTDPVAFFAYVSFFPQLVAGPIERASSLLPQFLKPRQFQYSVAVDGLRQMLWGFFKKVVVADNCAEYVDLVFSSPESYSGSSLFLAAVLFTIQIYGDFSGYSDIAIGCSKLFGIQLRRNFSVPYFSRDIAEFWRRWHISLSSWFRDYVYIPLGGSRCSRLKVIRNTFIIFLLSGFWHGANWTFLAWGLYHALLFIPLILLGRNRRFVDVAASGRTLPSLVELFQMLFTFILVVFGWIIFRSPSIGFAVNYIAEIFSDGLFSAPFVHSVPIMGVLVFSIAVMFVVEWVNRNQSHTFALQPCSRILRWGFYIVLLSMVLTCAPTSEMPFIYFQF